MIQVELIEIVTYWQAVGLDQIWLSKQTAIFREVLGTL
jgi:hypothetical protein